MMALDPDTLIACPTCDALHRSVVPPTGGKARCSRCGTTLISPRDSAMTRIVMLAATALILMFAAVFFPFLELRVGTVHQRSSVFDAAMSFSDGLLLPLSFAVTALIIVLPVLRLSAILYALVPMMIGYLPARHARTAFRLSQRMKPWAMAEIFVVGVAVALIKLAGLATVSVGPAFWALAGLVVVITLQDTFMCKLTIWKTLEERDPC